MGGSVLLTGATGFLGGYLALELLARTDADLWCVVRAPDPARALARVRSRIEALVGRYGWPDGRAPRAPWERLRAVAGSLADLERVGDALPPTLDALWHAAALLSFDERSREPVTEVNVGGTRAVLAAAFARGVRSVSYVSTAYVAGARAGTVPEGPADERHPAQNPYEESKRVAERLVVDGCRAHGARFRVFRPSIVMGDSRDHRADSEASAYGFASAVATLRGEIGARLPDYFDAHPLRVLAVPRHALSFVAVDRAAEAMVRAAGDATTADRWFHVVSTDDTRLEDVLDAIGDAAGVRVRVATDERELNPMDALLRTRTTVYQCYLSATKHFESSVAPAAGMAADALQVGVEDHRRWFLSHRDGRAAELVERRSRMKRALSTLDRQEVARPGGRPLVCYVGGRGPRTVVVVNAYGQSLYFWNWFVLATTAHHRVVLWQARGTADDHEPGRPFRLADQADDLLAILDHVGVDRADLLAWCTGPKVALEVARRAPDRVRSLVLLTGAYKPLAGFEHLQTAYEESMEPLCRAIDAAPEAAADVMDALRAIVAGRQAAPAALDAQIADVLALVPDELRALVIRPFLDAPSIVRYARQLIDFWETDVSHALRALSVPALFVGAEYDAIASPQITRAAAEACPGAWWAEVVGGTHFSMFENHELVTALVHAFLDDPSELRFRDPQLRIGRVGAPPPVGAPARLTPPPPVGRGS